MSRHILFGLAALMLIAIGCGIYYLYKTLQDEEKANKALEDSDTDSYDQMSRLFISPALRKSIQEKRLKIFWVGCSIGLLIFAFSILGVPGFAQAALIIVIVFAIRFTFKFKKEKLKTKMADQLPTLVDMILYQNRLGIPIHVMLLTLEKQSKKPLKIFFEKSNQKIRGGLLPYQALKQTAQEFEVLELDLLCVLLSMQYRYGFSTQDTFNFLSQNWRDQLILKSKIKAILAEMKVSLFVVAALPVIAALINYLRMPKTFALLFTTSTGYMVTGLAVTLYLLGIFSFRFIVSKVAN